MAIKTGDGSSIDAYLTNEGIEVYIISAGSETDSAARLILSREQGAALIAQLATLVVDI